MTKIFLLISVDDLRRLIEKAGGKFEGNLYSESVTMVASMESAGQVSFIILKIYLFEFYRNEKLIINLLCLRIYLYYVLISLEMNM